MFVKLGLVLFYIRCLCCYLVFNYCTVSNIGLYMSIYLSFICSLSLLVLCMWYFSNVFRCFPFSSGFMMSTVSVILPYVCPVFSMRFEYPELLLLFLISCIQGVSRL
jgi:hypothetical protein